ncbi:MAG: hypothetical protein HC875_33395 [Anaerolineales bacterium]|nr:hypothetical protein [Anaerolineales bacterium]
MRTSKLVQPPQHFWFPTKDEKLRDAVRKSEKTVIDFQAMNFDKDNFGGREYKKIVCLFQRKFLTNNILDLSNNKSVESVSLIEDKCFIKFNLTQN